jgi:calcineurin-like phosphoesterase family protein
MGSGMWLAALAAAAGCAQSFPPGWVYVTRVGRTGASVVWTGPGSRVACRGREGTSAEAPGVPYDRGLLAARVETLRPDTTYACRILDADGRRVARVRFRTAPEPGAAFLFAVVGDSGHGGIVGRTIARRIRAAHPAFFIHLGDFAYTYGTVEEYGKSFFDVYRQTLRRVPIFPTPGNHDLYHRSIYRALFAPAYDGTGVLRYHFTWGAASFASLSARDGAAGAPGLADDLAAGGPGLWRIVFLHEPIYTAGRKRVEPGLREALEPVVEAAGVDMVLAGHQHFYERSLPSCEFVPGARVMHVTSGGGSGVGLDPVREHPNFARASSEPNFLRIRVTADWLDIRAVGPDGHSIDHVRRARGTELPCATEEWPRQHRRPH